MSNVQAVLISGGFGTRMLPLTQHRPKHLLNVGGVPFVEHQLTKLAAAGVEHVVLATSYRAELFKPVLGDGERFGLRLSYVQEEEPLGTAGAIRNVAEALGDDPDAAIVILNGDVLSGHDLRAQLADFETPRDGRQVEVSLHLVEVPDARAFGSVPTDEAGRVTAFLEKSETPVTNQINAGCYIFRRSTVDKIPPGQVVSVERETFPALVADDAIVVGYVENAYWRDVGNPGALVAASKDLVLGTGRDAHIAADAKVSGTVDGGSVVDAGATVEDGATVTGSVVMAGAVVRSGAVLLDSVVGPGALIGAGAKLDRVTVGDDAVVPDGATPEPDSRIEA
ncbi:MAG TPA: NDP-sugar synthase [Nocardioidaceae bacterium]|nr:NDP-sugar synthase [Nocardioidaceae bacterium]